jgi:uncharacterized damage-inducible protein DinB
MTTLQSTDIYQAVQYFEQTRSRVIEVTRGLSEAQWRFKPAPDRWSIQQNLEHMVIVEERVLGPIREQLAQASAPAADRDHQVVDRIIFEDFPDRSIKAKAPEFIEPTGQWLLSESLDRLSRNYERLTAFVETHTICATTSWSHRRCGSSPTERTKSWMGTSGH